MPRTLEPPAPVPHEPLAPVALSSMERDALLDLARAALAAAVGAGPERAVRDALTRHPVIDRRAAAFVTLTEDGELRGCIGHMDASAPVTESVVEAATWAALEDPRFATVQASELARIHLDVSVLGPLVRLDGPGDWEPGIDGIVVERSGRRGLLLPEVAAMRGMDRTAMLDTCCRKAGLPAKAWREPSTTLYAFRTDRFGGPAVPAAQEPHRG